MPVTALVMPIVALAAGLVSFTSPCCLPLVPGYLSYVSAVPVSSLSSRDARATTLRAALLFVTGFTLVFTGLGVSAAFLGSALTRNLPVILQVLGVAIIVVGLAMLGVFRLPFLYVERRIDLARLPRGPQGAIFMGMAFAFGWVPCIGPVLATILTAASATGTAVWGGILLVFYSLGLGIPFVALAVGFDRARGSLAWLRRHGRAIERIGGLMLIGVGVLYVTGGWRSLFLPLQREFARLGWPPI